MTLRLRLVIALVGLVAAGLLIADTANYLSLRSFLIERVDQQLLDARVPIHQALTRGVGTIQGASGRAFSAVPPGTYGELRDADGKVLNSVIFQSGDSKQPVPDLPSSLPAVDEDAGHVTFTTRAISDDDDDEYRVLVQRTNPDDGVLIVAAPLADVQLTLRRLILVEALVTFIVLAGLGVLARWLVRRELRPLEGMAAAAGRIAAGDLSERVSPAERRTEVGHLGLALNGMLERIELAFAERTASEERLRRFLADASHELRTPLTSIRGYAEMFHRGAKDDPEDLGLVMRRIEEEGQRMGIMVEELLLLARLGEGREPEREPVNIARLVEDAVLDARAADTERPISLATPAELFVLGDELQLRQVVANLVGNAQRHTPEGTPIRVEAVSDDGAALFEVADEGPGLAPEVAARAFEPFYRADPARTRETGGAGLGLAIVAAIVEAHSGSVAVTSTPDSGATFSVRLPLTAAPEDSATAAPPAAET